MHMTLNNSAAANMALMAMLHQKEGNAEIRMRFGQFLQSKRGRAWRLKHRRRVANAA